MRLTKKRLVLLLVVAGVGIAGLGAAYGLYKRRQAGRALTAEDAFAQGAKLLESRSYLEAYRLLGYAAQKSPSNVEIQFAAGRAALELHRRDIALPHFRAAWDGGKKTREVCQGLLQTIPYTSLQERLATGMSCLRELPEGHQRMELEADLKFSCAVPGDALRLWKEVFDAAPSPSLATRIGLAHVALGNSAEGETFLLSQKNTPTLNDEGYAVLARIQADRDDRKRSEETFAEGRRKFPQSDVLRLNEGIYMLSEDRLSEAIAQLTPLRERTGDSENDGRHHQARLYLGFAYSIRGESAQLSVLEETAQGDTSWLEGERLLYRTLRIAIEKRESARSEILKARKLLGTQPAVEWLAGRYFATQGQWTDATSAYRAVSGPLARSPLLHYELSQALYRSGKVDEALESLRRLHARKLYSKASMELFRNLAIQKGLGKDADEAQKFLQSQFREDPSIEFAGGLMALFSGNLNEASRVFDEMAFRNPDSPDVESARLAVLLARKDYEGVLRECAASRSPLAALARFRAAALVRLNRLDEAEDALQRGIADRPDWSLRLVHANLLLSRGKSEAAEREYGAVLKAQPKNDVARLGLAILAARGGRWREVLENVRPMTDANSSAPMAYLLLGEAELHGGQPDRALKAAERVLNLVAGEPGGLLLQGAAALALGKPEVAETALLACSAKRPEDAAVQWHLAQARIARGAYEEALTGVETALARGSTGNVPLQQVRMVLLAQTGRGTEARSQLERLAPQISPVQVRLCQAWMLKHEGQLSQAAALLRPGIEDRGTALFWAEIMLAQGNAEGVLEALDRHALDSSSWARMSELARNKGLGALAVECCRRALKTDPDNASILNNFAWFSVQLPSFSEVEAISAARKAAALLPTNLAVLHTYGTVLLRCNKERDCIDLLARAGSAVERSPKLMLLLAQAYEKSDNRPKAVQWYLSCLNHPETADVESGELSRPALQAQLQRLKAKSP